MKTVLIKLGFAPELFVIIGLIFRGILYTAIALAVIALIAGAFVYLGF